jgi:hypothetical protein
MLGLMGESSRREEEAADPLARQNLLQASLNLYSMLSNMLQNVSKAK